MTGEFVVWCTRDELGGDAPLDYQTSPPAFRHKRRGRCACGQEHGAGLPDDRFVSVAEVLGTVEDEPAQISDHEVYAYAIGLLDLRSDALADLTRRGLSIAVIGHAGYRSAPADAAERSRFLEKLVVQFGEERLRACAGFVDRHGALSFWTGASYVVPYLDENRRITGLQCKVIGGKYLTARGARAAAMYHVAGPVAGRSDLIVTEGGLKAGVSAHLLGDTMFFGIAGQTLSDLHLAAIARLRPTRVIVALDREANDVTQHARQRWIKQLFVAGFDVREAVWEGQDVSGPKGIDDLLHAGAQPRIRQRAVTPPDITKRRVPAGTTDKGPTTSGLPFNEARARTQKAIGDFLLGHGRGRARAQLVRSSPGVGKTYAVAQALHPAASARIAVGTTRLAAELGATYGFGVVRGRNAENCQQFELTEALGKRGHNVAELACGTAAEPRCPYRANCPYWRQFEQRGPLVAAAEQLFNPAFIRPASVVVVDDADLARSLIECHTFSVGMLTHAVRQLTGGRRDPLRQLLRILGIALVEPPAHPLRGAAVWDRLAWVAAVHGRSLVQIIAALPQHPTLPSPTPDTDGRLSVEAVDKAPPAALLHVVRALQEELPAFLAGEDFNSRLRLNAEGIEVARLRDHPADALGRVYIDQADLLVLDATPIDPLVDHLTRRHERLPDVVAEVALPSNVRVVQYAERPNGHRALSDQAQLGRVLAEIERERRASPTTDPTKEAVIGYRGSRDALLQAGFAASQVLTFGSARGTNALADVDRLHVVGRPMPPAQEMAYLAQVIHHDERPVSEQLRLGARPFGGQPHAVDVVDFIDPRVSALLRARRDDEVLQAVHRARVGCLVPQQRLDGTDRATRAVTLVIHTSHPIPGLRVE